MIGVFKKNISYQSGCIIYDIYIGEHRDYEFLKQNIPNHILERYINDGYVELFQSNEELKQYENNTQPIEAQQQDENIFETMYKTTQPIQDKDGNEIELGTQFSESELKQIISQDKRQSKKKIVELLQDEKIMELKIVK